MLSRVCCHFIAFFRQYYTAIEPNTNVLNFVLIPFRKPRRLCFYTKTIKRRQTKYILSPCMCPKSLHDPPVHLSIPFSARPSLYLANEFINIFIFIRNTIECYVHIFREKKNSFRSGSVRPKYIKHPVYINNILLRLKRATQMLQYWSNVGLDCTHYRYRFFFFLPYNIPSTRNG